MERVLVLFVVDLSGDKKR
uniref:Uncharacterized protein n=1 Tax=Moniliophthora roreri TaxID=221103 RepID=A0A0W0GBA9_MONRR